ncbi:S8 family serine peptidase [Pyxidicoccus caerfyrddinensis]|uniref:S8 family serine peptidase n=1 Tax=Pyxidicoccus caerfyrddinensis TaxID=2709663 RepID=UPI0013DC15F1|nr:S8 family serine peptidase [Pyxidicoccus caerfyrddinensis]
MARLQASVSLDPFRAPEQLAFLRERVEVLQESGLFLWVSLEEGQVDTLIAQGLQVIPRPEASVVELPALAFNPESEPPELPAALRAEEPSGEASGDYLVMFRAPIDKPWLQEIATLGGEFLQALPSQSAVFRFTRQEAEAVRALAFVAYVGPFHPAYAVSPDLTGTEEPFTATSLRNMQVTLPPEEPDGNLLLRFFDGVNPESYREAVEAAGATIVADTAHGFRVRAPPERANDILRVPGLFAVQPPTTTELVNNNGGVILGTNQVRQVGTVNFLVNLNGVGEVAGMVDSGCDVGNLAGAIPPFVGAVMTPFHTDLRTNVRLVRNSANPQNVAGVAPDASPHGTHVAGTICGDGTSSAGQARGMAPSASLVALGPLPANFEPPFEFAFQNGARIINNSWGSSFSVGVNNNRYIPTHGFALDRWCFDHPDVLLVFAAGNDETDVAGGGNGTLDANNLKLEATAKNVLTVGASENLRNNGGWRDSYRTFFGPRYNNAAFNVSAGGAPGAFSFSDNHNEVALFSSRGTIRTNTLVNTQRVKPDIVAIGTNVLSLRSQWVAPPPALPVVPPPISAAFWNTNFDSMLPAGFNRNLYQIFSGTSMATPMTTGSAILVRQYYRTRFAQLRRPVLLEGVAIPAAAPLPTFTAHPSSAPHVDGLVFAWVTAALPAGQKNVLAMRLSRALAPLDAAPVHLQDNVGDHAAPKVATRGERTYLLHRHGDNTMRLSCYGRTLALEAGFGTNGVVTLAPNARPDDNVLPDLLVVGEHVCCAYPATGGNGYFFQRFRADTGAAVDGAPVSFLFNTNTGPHRSVAHAGTRYTVCGVAHPGNYQLQTRQLGDDGALVGAGPTTLVDQVQEIREPCLIWNERLRVHVVVWVDARTVPGGEIYLLFVDANGAAIRAPRLVMSVPAANHIRRPRLLVHPEVGHVLLWEDDSQNAHYDLYVALLDETGQVDGRLPADANDPLSRKLIRISDTPEDTAGFAALADARGLSLVFQSPDEINSDRLGAYALNLTPAAAFEAQEDPSSPLLRSGRYTKVDLLSHGDANLMALSAEWTGGAWYLLRLAPAGGGVTELQWVRLNPDGLVDATYGVNGVRSAPVTLLMTSCQLLWTGSGLVTAGNDLLGGLIVHRHDDQGAPVAGFGAGGAVSLQDTATFHDHVIPQVGWDAGSSQVQVAYGTTQAGVLQLRYQRLNNAGVRVGAPVNLTAATGVAPHNWFQFVPSENRSIALYHRVNGAVTRVHCRRFLNTGAPSGGELDVSAVAGEAINAVLARRPTLVNSPSREYGAVWQYRANNAARWELRFSRLDRLGQPMGNPPAPPAPALPPPPLVVADVPVIAAGPDWPADREAVEPQLVSTYTHWPWSNPPAVVAGVTSLPDWSPSYGLAWIGVLPDGSRVLFFTVLDENGRRAMLPQPPPVGPGSLTAPAPAPLLQLTGATSRVRNFKLVWNGRVFLLYWAEEEGGQLKHRCTAVNRHANTLAYELPSAALLRATLVNGATNMSAVSLPDAANGYGWGRVNLRQTLAPTPPVTLQVRDDCTLGPRRSVTYRFNLPAGTALLRVTLNWTDPPGARVVNPLHLTVRAPAVGPNPRPEYRGNLWDTVAGRRHLSRPVASPPVAADNHENIQTFKQVVIANPPPGAYDVEVSVGSFPADPFNQQNLQAFALVFAGTGPEVTFNQPVANVQGAAVY